MNTGPGDDEVPDLYLDAYDRCFSLENVSLDTAPLGNLRHYGPMIEADYSGEQNDD